MLLHHCTKHYSQRHYPFKKNRHDAVSIVRHFFKFYFRKKKSATLKKTSVFIKIVVLKDKLKSLDERLLLNRVRCHRRLRPDLVLLLLRPRMTQQVCFNQWQYSTIRTFFSHTICPRRNDPFHIVSWVTTSWTHSMQTDFFCHHGQNLILYVFKLSLIQHNEPQCQ